MASQSDQPCFVCGKMTNNRCSACVTAGMSVLFCSATCQKLHKKVCGPRSNPFLWPPLSPHEEKRAVANLDFQGRAPDGTRQPTLRKAMVDCGVKPDAVEAAVHGLTSKDPSELLSQNLKQDLLARARFAGSLHADNIFTADPDADDSHEPGLWSDINFASTLAMGTPSVTDLARWQSELRHRIVVMQTLMDLAERRAHPQAAAFARVVVGQIRLSIDVDVVKEDPRITGVVKARMGAFLAQWERMLVMFR
ncbi:hypothetical protein JCM10449v2_003505 [Rhodotorula kratochvilovae]